MGSLRRVSPGERCRHLLSFGNVSPAAVGALDTGRAVALVGVGGGNDGAMADAGRWQEVIRLGTYWYIELTVLLGSEGQTEPSLRAKHVTADNTFSHRRAHPRKAMWSRSRESQPGQSHCCLPVVTSCALVPRQLRAASFHHLLPHTGASCGHLSSAHMQSPPGHGPSGARGGHRSVGSASPPLRCHRFTLKTLLEGRLDGSIS